MDIFIENNELSVLVIYECVFQKQNRMERELDFLRKAFANFVLNKIQALA